MQTYTYPERPNDSIIAKHCIALNIPGPLTAHIGYMKVLHIHVYLIYILEMLCGVNFRDGGETANIMCLEHLVPYSTSRDRGEMQLMGWRELCLNIRTL